MRAFDVYRGEQVGPGKKSIAFSVTFQSPERTLTDEDAAELRSRVVSALETRVRRPAPGLRSSKEKGGHEAALLVCKWVDKALDIPNVSAGSRTNEGNEGET